MSQISIVKVGPKGSVNMTKERIPSHIDVVYFQKNAETLFKEYVHNASDGVYVILFTDGSTMVAARVFKVERKLDIDEITGLDSV